MQSFSGVDVAVFTLLQKKKLVQNSTPYTCITKCSSMYLLSMLSKCVSNKGSATCHILPINSTLYRITFRFLFHSLRHF